nr:hypothetical protein [Tanacetum cinerariifolium]
MGTVRFENDQIAKIMGYGDYQLENTSLICLLSKASKTKSLLWHRWLSHLNFDTLNKLAKDGLERGIPKLKFQKDHLCSACALGKSKKTSHQLKIEDTYQEKLYLLHMDLCARCAKLLRSKDEAPNAIIKCIKNIQVRLNTTVRNVRTNNETDVNQTLHDLYENVDVSHQTFVAHTPQQKVLVVGGPRAVDIADSPVSTPIDQDAPSTSIPSTQEQELSPIISQGIEESPKTPHFHNDPLHESLHEDSTPQGSSSNVRPSHTPFELIGRWTKDHPIVNVIGDPSRSVSMRNKLETGAMWCYFDAFLTFIKPKNFKQAMTKPSWIDAMQEEIHEFERLQV